MLQHAVHEIASSLLTLIVDPRLQPLADEVLLIVPAVSDTLRDLEESEGLEDERMREHATQERSGEELWEDVADPVVVGGGHETVKGLTKAEVSDYVEGGVVIPFKTPWSAMVLIIPPWD